MVFFTCSHCGESIKKPSVAKHYQTKCRNQIPFLTCVDCLKDFRESEYESHTKCFTEEERYSAKGFVPKASSNKGERKQKAWSDCAQGLLSSGILKPDERNFLQAIVKYDNIPRKKVKFINFLTTTARNFINKPDLIDRVWEKMENYFKEANSESKNIPENGEEEMHSNEMKTCQEKEEERGVEEGAEKKKKKKRKKHSINEDEKVEVQNEDEKKKKLKADETEEARPKSKKSKKCEEEVKAEIGDKEDIKEEEKCEKKKKKRAKKCEEEVKIEVDDKENMKEEVQDEGKKKEKSKINGMNDTEEPKSKKLKKCEEEAKTEVNGMENVEEEKKDEENQHIFNWKDIILRILSTNGNGNQITLKRLQKKVLKKYCKHFDCEVDDKIIKKFMKKLNKMSEVTVNDDCVSLSNC